MNRREFFRRAGGGVLLGAPLATLPSAASAFSRATSADGVPLQVIGQLDRPAAIALAQQLAAALGSAGRAAPLQQRDGAALRQLDQLDALLALPRGTHLLGVMDDASAVVFQAVAASRGAHLLAHGHHRLGAGSTRHACTATACGEALAWREAATRPGTHVEAFYRAALGSGQGPAHAPGIDPALAGATDTLASFLIRL